jgi:hypothetical protein
MPEKGTHHVHAEPESVQKRISLVDEIQRHHIQARRDEKRK